jgi:hypothetical protein
VQASPLKETRPGWTAGEGVKCGRGVGGTAVVAAAAPAQKAVYYRCRGGVVLPHCLRCRCLLCGRRSRHDAASAELPQLTNEAAAVLQAASGGCTLPLLSPRHVAPEKRYAVGCRTLTHRVRPVRIALQDMNDLERRMERQLPCGGRHRTARPRNPLANDGAAPRRGGGGGGRW